MTKISKKEFDSLVEDITNNQDFNKIDKELHHGITRYEHSMRVARHTYVIGKMLHLKTLNETTRAALLHDFYINDDLKGQSGAKKLATHPAVALQNSLKYYDLNEIQQDIIKSHMFPCNLTVPKYKESWLVSTIDKSVGLYEMLRFKVSLYTGIYLLFLFEIIKLPR